MHLGGIGSHPLGDSHIGPTGRLLDHHRGRHGSLWVHKLRRSWVVPHVRWLWSSLVHIKLRHAGLLEGQLCVGNHRRRVSNVVVLEPRRRENLRARRRQLHSMGIIEMRGPRMMLLRMKMRSGRARHRRHAGLLEGEGHLGLVRHLGVGGGAVLRDSRHSDRLEHLRVSLLFVASRNVPGWQSPVGRRNASVEGEVLISLFGTLFLHTFNGVELVSKRRAFSNRPGFLCPKESRGARGTGDRAASEKRLRACSSTRTGSESTRSRVRFEFHGPDIEL